MGASQVQSKKNPLIVRTDRMGAHSIAERMADMRTWLDRNKVELVPLHRDYDSLAVSG
jgi:hypothetical protein